MILFKGKASAKSRNAIFSLAATFILCVAVTWLYPAQDASAQFLFQRPELATSYTGGGGGDVESVFSGNSCTVPAVGMFMEESVTRGATSLSLSAVDSQSTDQGVTITYDGVMRRPITIVSTESILCSGCGKVSSRRTPVGVAFVPWTIVYSVSGSVEWFFNVRDGGWQLRFGGRLVVTTDPTSVPCGLDVPGGVIEIGGPADGANADTVSDAFPVLIGLPQIGFFIDEDLTPGCSAVPMPSVGADSACGDISISRNVRFDRADLVLIPGSQEEMMSVEPPSLEVNSTGDEEDADLSDEICDIGAATPADDPPVCTLRAAIQQANANEGEEIITFNIPGPPPHTILPLSELPAITDTVTIDGTTQPGFDPGDIQAFGGPPLDPGSPPRLIEARRAMSVGMQEGVPDDPKIILDGTNAGRANGYLVKAKNVGIRGKRIVNFQKAGIKLTKQSGKVKIKGNFIGVGQDGTAQGNLRGIKVLSSGNTIGGITQVPGKAPGNVISGNKRFGIHITGIEATKNRVLGNLFGLDPSGTNPLGNTGDGILIGGSSDNIIGGASAGAGNVISGNQLFGIKIVNKEATRNTVAGNVIGLDKTGAKAMRSEVFPFRKLGFGGVRILSAPGNMIGGTQAGAGNVISGNAFDGIKIENEEATGNMVVGNLIGFGKGGTTAPGNSSNGIDIASARGTIITSNHIGGNGIHGVWIGSALFDDEKKGATKTILQGNRIGESPTGLPFPNGENGVFVTDSAKNNTIGGIEPSDGNIITTRDQSAVVIESGKKNRILANTITLASPELGTIAIDLGDDGITLNDIDGANTDADKGPNNLQNFPAIFQAKVEGGTLEVTGALFSKPSLGYTIRVFTCNGNPGHSFTFVGTRGGVNTDADGKGDFTFTNGNTQVQPGTFVAATATDVKGNTSEFSIPCQQVR